MKTKPQIKILNAEILQENKVSEKLFITSGYKKEDNKYMKLI